jgi:hypothetical protein
MAAGGGRVPGSDVHPGRPESLGVLAVYRVRNDGILKGLKRWPKAIEEY